MSNQYQTKQEILQNCEILFKNLKNNAMMSSKMAEFGYDEVKISEGKALYEKTNTSYLENIQKTQEETSLYKVFKDNFDKMVETYRSDKKKIRIVFKEKQDVLKNLRLLGREATKNTNLLDDMLVMYDTLHKNTALKQEVSLLKISSEYIEEQLSTIEEVKNQLASYTLKKGDKQQSTKDTNKDFEALTKWVKTFFEIAKIAFEDKPQLLEGLKKAVR